MNRTINIGNQTKPAHTKYVEWLNSLLNNYVSSFYDDAIKNILDMSFLRSHNALMLETYDRAGVNLVGFISVLPTDTTDFIIMYHNISDGLPILYNKQDGANLFDFNSDGTISKFTENIAINLYDVDGNATHKLFITFEDLFGVKFPMFYVKTNTDSFLTKGLLDLGYDGRYSGTYLVNNTPLSSVVSYEVTNISVASLVLDIPILTNLNSKYDIPPKGTIFVPVTEWTTYFLKSAETLGNIAYRKVTQ